MTEFYAQPYSLDHTGFYFNSPETFDAGMERLNRQGCEEVEIQFIDGDDHLATLAKIAELSQATITTWFETLEDLDATEAEQLSFLLDMGYDLTDALDRYDEVCFFEGSASDYAYDLINETTEIPDNLSMYIDYDAIARDMKLNGEIVELERERLVTNAHDF